MNVKIAKIIRTSSSEELCILLGTTPIIIGRKRLLRSTILEKEKELNQPTWQWNPRSGHTLLKWPKL